MVGIITNRGMAMDGGMKKKKQEFCLLWRMAIKNVNTLTWNVLTIYKGIDKSWPSTTISVVFVPSGTEIWCVFFFGWKLIFARICEFAIQRMHSFGMIMIGCVLTILAIQSVLFSDRAEANGRTRENGLPLRTDDFYCLQMQIYPPILETLALSLSHTHTDQPHMHTNKLQIEKERKKVAVTKGLLKNNTKPNKTSKPNIRSYKCVYIFWQHASIHETAIKSRKSTYFYYHFVLCAVRCVSLLFCCVLLLLP